MVLIAHIVVALSSLLVATYTVFFPSQRLVRVSSAMAGFTIASGTYLIIWQHAQLLQTCLSGLTYLAVMAVFLAVAEYRLKLMQRD